MNQSLLSQSLSDLRNPPGSKRASGEWRMFSSDSDIKDIKEGEREGGEGDDGEAEGENCSVDEGVGDEIGTLGEGSLVGDGKGSNESVDTLKNPSASNSAQVCILA